MPLEPYIIRLFFDRVDREEYYEGYCTRADKDSGKLQQNS